MNTSVVIYVTIMSLLALALVTMPRVVLVSYLRLCVKLSHRQGEGMSLGMEKEGTAEWLLNNEVVLAKYVRVLRVGGLSMLGVAITATILFW